MKNTNNSHYNDGRRAAKLLFEPLTRINSSFVAGSLFRRPMGLRVYGAGAISLGVVGLAWGDFALVWQPVPSGVPGRTVLAYLTAAALLLSGIALQWRRTASAGIIALSTLYAMCVLLLHVPRVVAHPADLGSWAGVAEQLALVAAGLVGLAAKSPSGERLAKRTAQFGRSVFALCVFCFGLVHFVYVSATAAFVPNWLPPGQMFWAYATGLAHWAAGLAILSGILAKAAARLLTVMFVLFSILIHAPALLVDPGHLSWTANAMNLALIGAAWLIADSLLAWDSEAA